eukprot:CAMPEP_0115524050 /NCGR_PEP_ID=MMETSP0271-20121206/80971_1 /TAXON_ID=71861 /ORGANISM="Scrippsiella trochoidea, Strain CCMP3099" /LENGTH=34 /DNA_ID= /DNA_START= /DNA_END= /DNA_ORIENTATION=
MAGFSSPSSSGNSAKCFLVYSTLSKGADSFPPPP